MVYVWCMVWDDAVKLRPQEKDEANNVGISTEGWLQNVSSERSRKSAHEAQKAVFY